jgi:hypothetical protein
MIDWSKCERQVHTLTISEHQAPTGNSPGWVVFKDDTRKVKYFADAVQRFSAPLEVGSESEASVTVKEKEWQGEKVHEGFLVGWGKSAGKAPYSGGGGGGKWQPKPESENLSIMAQTALNRAVDMAIANNTQRGVEDSKRTTSNDVCVMQAMFMESMTDSVAKSKGKLG